MLGDCLERMKEIPDGSVDLTVTSPPYDNLRTYNNTLEWGEHVWKPVLQELFRVTKTGGVVVWIVSDATIKGSETGTSFRQALYAKEIGFNLHDTMIWEKHSFNHDPRNKRYKQHFEYNFILSKGKPKTYNEIKDVPVKNAGKRYKSSKRLPSGNIRDYGYITMNDFQARSNIWKIGQDTKNIHPAPFPEQLANDHITSWSNENDVVFDPFMGSGTTGKMALLNNRKFIGIEKDETYFKIAQDRIAAI
jgi:site-specific DNA-methyltransferase (adenine-specific)